MPKALTDSIIQFKKIDESANQAAQDLSRSFRVCSCLDNWRVWRISVT